MSDPPLSDLFQKWNGLPSELPLISFPVEAVDRGYAGGYAAMAFSKLG